MVGIEMIKEQKFLSVPFRARPLACRSLGAGRWFQPFSRLSRISRLKTGNSHD